MKNRRTNLEVLPEEPDKAQDPDVMDKALPTHKPARLGREVQARIGQQLRGMYEDVLNQGVPPHIADLIRRISEQE